MDPAPGGSSLTDDDARRITRFDATAAQAFQLLCRLTDGDLPRVEPLLVNVYVSTGDPAAEGAGSDHGHRALEAAAFRLALAANGDGWARGGLSTLDRAILHLDRVCSDTELAQVVARPIDDLAVLRAALHDRLAVTGGVESGSETLALSDRWLDDVTLDRVREAIRRGVEMPIGPADVAAAMFARPDRSGWEPVRRDAENPPGEARPRRLMVISVLVIASVLGAGALWVAPNDPSDADSDELTVASAPATSVAAATTSPPSTTPRTTDAPTPTTESPYTGPRLVLTPGFVLDPQVAGTVPITLWEARAEDFDGQYLDGWYELWAEPDATRTSGRWIVVSTSRADGYSFDLGLARDQQRIAGDGWSGLLTTPTIGTVALTMTVEPPHDPTSTDGSASDTTEAGVTDPARAGDAVAALRVMVEAHGFSVDEVIAVASSFEVDAEQIVRESDFGTSYPPSVSTGPGPAGLAVLTGLAVAESGPAACCSLYGFQRYGDSRSLTYQVASDVTVSEQIRIQTTDGVDPGTTMDKILGPSRSSDPDFPASASATVVIGDRLVHVSGEEYVSGSERIVWHSAWWVQDGQTISVVGAIPVARLLALVPAVRRATRDEWLQLNEDAFREDEVEPYVDPMQGGRVALGRVDLGEMSWVSVLLNETGTAADISITQPHSSVSGPVAGWTFDPAAPVTEFSMSSLTVLLIEMPAQPGATHVRVTVGDRQRVTELVPVAETGLVAASDAFTELPPYTVELLDATGNVLSTLPA